jgi:hypothetical protein
MPDVTRVTRTIAAHARDAHADLQTDADIDADIDNDADPDDGGT